MVTEERTNEVRSLLATLRRWALGKPEIVAVGLVGSWVRDARMDSDAVDEGMRRIVADGVSVLYAPKRILAGLLDACGRSQATENSVGLGVGHA